MTQASSEATKRSVKQSHSLPNALSTPTFSLSFFSTSAILSISTPSFTILSKLALNFLSIPSTSAIGTLPKYTASSVKDARVFS